jgi:hypothetical protein
LFLYRKSIKKSIFYSFFYCGISAIWNTLGPCPDDIPYERLYCIRIRSSNAGTSIIGVYTDDLDGIFASQVAAKEAQVGIKSVYKVTDVPHMAIMRPDFGATLHADIKQRWER